MAHNPNNPNQPPQPGNQLPVQGGNPNVLQLTPLEQLEQNWVDAVSAAVQTNAIDLQTGQYMDPAWKAFVGNAEQAYKAEWENNYQPHRGWGTKPNRWKAESTRIMADGVAEAWRNQADQDRILAQDDAENVLANMIVHNQALVPGTNQLTPEFQAATQALNAATQDVLDHDPNPQLIANYQSKPAGDPDKQTYGQKMYDYVQRKIEDKVAAIQNAAANNQPNPFPAPNIPTPTPNQNPRRFRSSGSRVLEEKLEVARQAGLSQVDLDLVEARTRLARLSAKEQLSALAPFIYRKQIKAARTAYDAAVKAKAAEYEAAWRQGYPGITPAELDQLGTITSNYEAWQRAQSEQDFIDNSKYQKFLLAYHNMSGLKKIGVGAAVGVITGGLGLALGAPVVALGAGAAARFAQARFKKQGAQAAQAGQPAPSRHYLLAYRNNQGNLNALNNPYVEGTAHFFQHAPGTFSERVAQTAMDAYHSQIAEQKKEVRWSVVFGLGGVALGFGLSRIGLVKDLSHEIKDVLGLDGSSQSGSGRHGRPGAGGGNHRGPGTVGSRGSGAGGPHRPGNLSWQEKDLARTLRHQGATSDQVNRILTTHHGDQLTIAKLDTFAHAIDQKAIEEQITAKEAYIRTFDYLGEVARRNS